MQNRAGRRAKPVPLQWLMDEKSFLILKETVQEQTIETKKLVLQILDGITQTPVG